MVDVARAAARRSGRAGVVVALAVLLGGCFDFTTDAKFRPDGTALIDFEIAVATQLLAMEGVKANSLENCAILQGRLRPGVKVLKAAQGTRGDMMTCRAKVEIEDPVKSLQVWEATPSGKEAPSILPPNFRLQRRDARSYTLIGVFKPKVEPGNPLGGKSPVAAVLLASMSNHFITLSVSGARIENATGELSPDKRTVTWKLPLVMLVDPPPGFIQEVRADIVYQETLTERVKHWAGLD
jgi:hypothetical protein